MATEVSKDVIELHGEDDQQKDRPIIPIVRHVAEITERASEDSEPEHTQTDALDVALRLIRNQAPCGKQRPCKAILRYRRWDPRRQREEGAAETVGYRDER